MNWRDPAEEMPKDKQVVFVLLAPHKWRGSVLESAMSIEIVCGEAHSYGGICRIENFDELGSGSIGWYLGKLPENFLYDEPYGVAWCPVAEFPLPNWYRE